MNKNYKVLMISAASVALVAGFLSAVGSSSGFLQLEASRAIKTHTVSFTAEDVSTGTYDDYCYSMPLTLSKSDCIDDKDGNKYSVTSKAFDRDQFSGTYFYGDESIVFGGNYIAEFTGTACEYFTVHFLILRRAEFDLEKSFISYYLGVSDDDHYNNDTHFKVYKDDGESEYIEYCACDDFTNYSAFNQKKVMVNEVKLVFACER